MSAGNLYRYFRSKDAIVAGLSERDRRRWRPTSRRRGPGGLLRVRWSISAASTSSTPRARSRSSCSRSGRSPRAILRCAQLLRRHRRLLSTMLPAMVEAGKSQDGSGRTSIAASPARCCSRWRTASSSAVRWTRLRRRARARQRHGGVPRRLHRAGPAGVGSPATLLRLRLPRLHHDARRPLPPRRRAGVRPGPVASAAPSPGRAGGVRTGRRARDVPGDPGRDGRAGRPAARWRSAWSCPARSPRATRRWSRPRPTACG